MNHATRLRLVTPLALAAAMLVSAPAPAHADPDPQPSAGAPVFVSRKLAAIGDVQARSRAVAGAGHAVNAPGTEPTGTTVAVSAVPQRRVTASVGAREVGELLAQHRAELAACLPGDSDPAALVLLKAHVGADGKTVSADVASSSGVVPSAAACLAAVTAKVTFANHGPRAALVPLRLHVSEILKTENDPAPAASNASH
jgi:hypothetical protein